MSVLAAAWRRTIEVVLPARCVGCGIGGTYLCNTCLSSAKPAPPAEAGGAPVGITTVFAYEGVPRTAVHRLKYGNLRALAPLMAAVMARSLDPHMHVDAIVPVPLHPRRLRERGYNQASLLARGIAAARDEPVTETLLSRVTQVGHQVDARGRAERRANVAGAFAATSAATGLEVLLVDDVTTTGSTLAEAARALKAAGAHWVHGVTFARET